MGEGRSIWIGKDEHHGVRAQPRRDLKPPPHWRLEAVAATHMPRALTVSPDRRSAVFIEDRDTSDVWLLDLEQDSVPERLTTGREPANWWEDTPPRLSPDGSTVAYADDGHVWLVPSGGGPPRKLVAGDGSRWWTRATRGRVAWRLSTASSTRTATRASRSCPRTERRWPTRSRPPPISGGAARSGLRRSTEARCAGSPGCPTCTTAARSGRRTARRSPTPRSAAASTSCTSSGGAGRTTAGSRVRPRTTSHTTGIRTEPGSSPRGATATASASCPWTWPTAPPRCSPRAAPGTRP